MEYGLKTINDNSQIQIDSTYINYFLYEHDEGVSVVTYLDITFDTPIPYPPLIAIKPDSSGSGYCGLMRYTKSGDNYTGFTLASEYCETAVIDWQAFVPNKTNGAETYGLRIYNAAADLVFDSGYAPLIITDVDVVNPAYNAVVTITHPVDANAYFIMSHWGCIRYSPGGVPTYFVIYLGMFENISTTQVSFGGVNYTGAHVPSHPPAEDGFWSATWTILTVKKAF